MNIFKKIKTDSGKIWNYCLMGLMFGFLYAVIEHSVRTLIGNPITFLPLVARAVVAAFLLASSVGIFEILFKEKFSQKPFFYLVLVRSFFYTAIITFWLSIINGVWGQIESGISFIEGMNRYWNDPSYPINLLTVFLVLVLMIGLAQINSLHRKGELLNFVLGKYHHPQEVDRIFCFIDLKGSTTMAEHLGNLKFGSFLKDFYSDITEAIRSTKAEIYQYVGDEIILTWTFEEGLKANHSIQCYFLMQEIIDQLRPKYLQKYNYYPQFKAGLHAGKVLVTWVGEIKKEILYIGDVVNTTSRIQEDCKRLNKDCLISQDLLDKVDDLGQVKASFVDETIPRGKGQKVRLYSLEIG
ncbi:MAG: adenylate/guanylate cyclase domain-containing protein [Cyclobacteriaceae bacterium]